MTDTPQLDDDKARSLKRRPVDDSEDREGAVEDDMKAKWAAFLAMVEPLRRSTEEREHTPGWVLIREDRDRGHRPHLGF